jgi:hypothetical protein
MFIAFSVYFRTLGEINLENAHLCFRGVYPGSVRGIDGSGIV